MFLFLKYPPAIGDETHISTRAVTISASKENYSAAIVMIDEPFQSFFFKEKMSKCIVSSFSNVSICWFSQSSTTINQPKKVIDRSVHNVNKS